MGWDGMGWEDGMGKEVLSFSVVGAGIGSRYAV